MLKFENLPKSGVETYRLYGSVGVGAAPGLAALEFSTDHFFSVSPFSPKGKGRGTQKGEGTLTHSLDVKCNGRPP